MLTRTVLKISLSDHIVQILLLITLIALFFAIFRVHCLRRIEPEDWCILVDIMIGRSSSSLRWQHYQIAIGLIAEDEALAHQECLLADC